MAVKISKDWWKDDDKNTRKKKRLVHKFEQMRVTKSEDLPELMTFEEAAKLFKRHPRTVERWAKRGDLKVIKVYGRYFTTPEYIAEFLEAQHYRYG